MFRFLRIRETMEYFPLYGLVLMVLVAKSQDTGESIGPFFSSPPSSTPTVLSCNCFMSQWLRSWTETQFFTVLIRRWIQRAATESDGLNMLNTTGRSFFPSLKCSTSLMLNELNGGLMERETFLFRWPGCSHQTWRCTAVKSGEAGTVLTSETRL